MEGVTEKRNLPDNSLCSRLDAEPLIQHIRGAVCQKYYWSQYYRMGPTWDYYEDCSDYGFDTSW